MKTRKEPHWYKQIKEAKKAKGLPLNSILRKFARSQGCVADGRYGLLWVMW